MLGFIIIAHAPLASALKAVAAHAFPECVQTLEVLDVPADMAPEEIEALKAINKKLKGRTELQKNHHRPNTVAWAAWIIAKLGGWSGYASHRPPGPITFHNGMTRFQNIVAALKYV